MIPTIIINGFLGSGKTTLLRNILTQSYEQDLSVCVVVNDMSQLDVDGELIENTDIADRYNCNFESIFSDVISSKSGLKKLSQALENLTKNNNPDFIIIETSGSCHPLPLVEFFDSHPKYSLTGMLTLADSLMLAQDFDNGKQLIPQFQHNLQNNNRNMVNLLAEQIMFCSHLILTKTEEMEPSQLKTIAESIHPLNPYVSVISVSWGSLAVDKLLAMPDYNFDRVSQLINELKPSISVENLNHNIETVIIKDDRPFHPLRLWETCNQFLGQGVYRSKRFFWLAGRNKLALLWSQAAGSMSLEIVGVWRAGILEEKDNRLNKIELELLKEKLSHEKGRFGDRYCNLTIIGDKTQINQFANAIKNCFVNEEEIKHWQAGGEFIDPWPKNIVEMTN